MALVALGCLSRVTIPSDAFAVHSPVSTVRPGLFAVPVTVSVPVLVEASGAMATHARLHFTGGSGLDRSSEFDWREVQPFASPVVGATAGTISFEVDVSPLASATGVDVSAELVISTVAGTANVFSTTAMHWDSAPTAGTMAGFLPAGGSPLIDAGLDLSDRNGAALGRFYGTGPEMGAFEVGP